MSRGLLAEPDVFDRLSQEFPQVPPRIIATIVQRYLEHAGSLSEAIEACRVRLADACAL